MLRPWHEIETPVGIRVVLIAAGIIWIGVIDNGVRHIDIHAAERIDHAGKTAQAHPGIAVNSNAIIFLNRQTRQPYPVIKAVVLGRSQEKRLVDFMHPANLRHIHPRVARNRDHVDRVVIGIDMNNHHYLCQHGGEVIFPIVIAAQKQDIPGMPCNRSLIIV